MGDELPLTDKCAICGNPFASGAIMIPVVISDPKFAGGGSSQFVCRKDFLSQVTSAITLGT